MQEYKRLTNNKTYYDTDDCELDLILELDAQHHENVQWLDEICEKLNRLVQLEDKIENGTLVELDESLIGECVVGIHHFTNGTYELDLDENIVIGFSTDGIVTWNNYHKYNDYFKYGLFFLDTEKGRAEAKQRLKELKGEV